MKASMQVAVGLALVVGLGVGHIAGKAAGLLAQASSSPRLPPGVYLESGNRLPIVTRERLDDFGKTAYDAIQADIRAGRMLAGLYGPAGIRLYSPRVGDGTLRSNLYLRFDSHIGRRTYELAVLVTARELDQQFEWTAHEPAALKAGVEPEIVDIVKYRRPVTGLAPRDALVIQIGREVLGSRSVSLNTFNEVLRTFGETDLVDVVSVISDYAGTAVLLNAFDQQLPAGQRPLLPPR
jgi:4-carboxymuconolactone decarboxylase